MYYEAGFEGRAGRQAVAQVVLNRMRHPAFPHDVCSVVFQRSEGVCQFTFACDGAMARTPLPALWRETMDEAAGALNGKVFAPVGMATHYHASYVLPQWAPRLEKIAVIGTHLFYRWPRGWGLRGVFNAAYDGSEPALALAGLAEPASPAETLAAPTPREIAPRRAENEGGFIDPSKGWVPCIALPAGTTPPSAPPPAS